MNNKTQKLVASLNIIDDVFFQKMAEDIGFCEELLSTILEQKVIVKKVVQQNSIKNLQGRSVILDALCELEDGRICNIEVQKANDDNHEKRVRYNAACITANIMEPGEKFEKIPDVIGIFISKFDMFKKGKTIYHVDRIIREKGECTDNGFKEIYVNTKIDDGSDIAELMWIFKEDKAYNFEKFPKTSARKHHFKEPEGGSVEMCELVDNFVKEEAKLLAPILAQELAQELAQDMAKNMAQDMAKNMAQEVLRDLVYSLLEKGVSPETVKICVSSIPANEIDWMYTELQRVGA